MWRARPSAIAVLPTPASPTSSGLFLRRRQRVWIDPFDFFLAADQGIDLAGQGQLIEILGEAFEGAALFLCIGFGLRLLLFALRLRRLGDAMGNEVHHIQPGHVLALQEKHGMRILFAKDRDQHVGAGHFLLAR